MPRIWTDTLAAHKQEVREAILDTVDELVGERSLLVASMSGIAERAGIGRATLYKYFSDIPSIVQAWHIRQINRHADELIGAAAPGDNAIATLEDVLARHADVLTAHHGRHLFGEALIPGGDDRTIAAQKRIVDLVQALIATGADEGVIRDDLDAHDLARYALNATSAAVEATDPKVLLAMVLTTLRTPC